MEKEDFPGPKRAFLGEKHIIKQSMSPYSAYKNNQSNKKANNT